MLKAMYFLLWIVNESMNIITHMFLQIVHYLSFLFQEQTCEDQNKVIVELHGEEALDIHHAHKIEVVFQENTKYFYDLNDVRNEQVISFPLEKNQPNDRFDNIEQGTTFKNEGNVCLFVDHQGKVVIYNLQDPFTNLLESAVKEKFVLFINVGLGFKLEFELSFLKCF